MKKHRVLALLVLGLSAVALVDCASGGSTPVTNPALDPAHWTGAVATEMDGRYHPTIGTAGMVVADDKQAAEWGAEILRQGGNAVDAAVATAFAMAVTRPHYAAIGGGGFMVYCPAPKGTEARGAAKRALRPSAAGGKEGLPQGVREGDQAAAAKAAATDGTLTRAPRPMCHALDYREEAPGAATRDMYIRDGKARTDLSQDGALASGVPGVTAGLLTALERFGTMSRGKLLSRPIALAKNGYAFSSHAEAAAHDRWDAFNPESKKLFGCGKADAKGAPPAPCTPGTVIQQKDLAKVLEAISAQGARGFYDGWVAHKIADGLKAAGGIMTVDDLKHYKPKWREPVMAEYRGMEVISMPPPSAGGTVMLQMLGFMERADQAGLLDEGYGSAKTIHAIAYAMSLAFADRAKHFGDPDQIQVPVAEMLSKQYLDERWKLYDGSHFTSPADAGVVAAPMPKRPGDPTAVPAGLPPEGTHTTHFSVIDRHGNAVAITTTVNDNYGSGFVPPGTGVVMNNEMDDFSIQPGVPNLFGLVGAEANAVAAYKRPLSSMSPTIVRDASGMPHIVLGAAGGPTITTSVFLTLLNRLRFGMSLTDAVAAARVHQQWRPEELRFERQGLSSDTLGRLAAKGHKLTSKAMIGKIHALERFSNGRTWGVHDPRGEGGEGAE